MGIINVNVTVPLIALIAAAILLFLGGALVTKKFGTNWLAALKFVLDDEQLAALARLVWQAGLVPTVWRKVRFQDSEDAFAAWVVSFTRSMWDEQVNLQRAAVSRGMTGTKPFQDC